MAGGITMGFMDFLTTGKFNPSGAGNASGESNSSAAEKNSEKPGEMCPRACAPFDGCGECVKEQQAYKEGMRKLGLIEAAMEDPSIAKRKKITRCSLCGAGVMAEYRVCPYCDTPYPSDGIDFDFPESKTEQRALLNRAAFEAYDCYYKFSALQIKHQSDVLQSKMPSFLKGITGGLMSTTADVLKLSSDQLVAGAQKHGMSMSEYISGLAAGSVKNVKQEAIEEERVRQNQIHQRNMEIERQKNERLRKIQQEKNDIMMNRVRNTSYGYNGGAARSCYNCTYYSAPNQMCALNDNSTNAGDHCGCWKLK